MRKNIIKICVATVLAIILLAQLNYSVLAFGFADYDDATADAEANKQMQEQEKEVKESVGKSSNDYLSELSVDGYKITPTFERQTVNYEIKEAISVDQLKINAKPDDSRATVSGDGIVKLQSGDNDIRVDVKAENGTTRTYHIKVTKKVAQDLKITSLKLSAVEQNKNLYEQQISPEFNENTYLYTCDVYGDVNSIKIDAISNVKDANIKIEGNENLQEGLNTVTITAKSGEKETTYKIQVTKQPKQLDDSADNSFWGKNKIIIISAVAILLVVIMIITINKKKHKHTRNSKH